MGREREQPIVSFPLSPSSLSISKLKVEMLVECVCIRSEIKTVELVLCNIFTLLVKDEIHMYVRAMKHKLCNSGDYAYEVNVLIFTLKSGIAQYKDKWKTLWK